MEQNQAEELENLANLTGYNVSKEREIFETSLDQETHNHHTQNVSISQNSESHAQNRSINISQNLLIDLVVLVYIFMTEKSVLHLLKI